MLVAKYAHFAYYIFVSTVQEVLFDFGFLLINILKAVLMMESQLSRTKEFCNFLSTRNGVC